PARSERSDEDDVHPGRFRELHRRGSRGSQAAYNSAFALYPLASSSADEVSLEEVFEAASESIECKKALDAVKAEAAEKKPGSSIEDEDFRRSTLAASPIQRPSNGFMDGLRRLGKIATKVR
ncbi:MAG: hypothetical protein QOD90_1274, partial [Mycobacterium sp.]|nr:hypothetical protein [Mycobacterium sp.]